MSSIYVIAKYKFLFTGKNVSFIHFLMNYIFILSEIFIQFKWKRID